MTVVPDPHHARRWSVSIAALGLMFALPVGAAVPMIEVSPDEGPAFEGERDDLDGDGDGLTNKAEFKLIGSDFGRADSDQDGIPDAVDLVPNDAAGANDFGDGLEPATLVAFKLPYLNHGGGCEGASHGHWDPYVDTLSVVVPTAVGDLGGQFLVPPGMRGKGHDDGRRTADLGEDAPSLKFWVPQDMQRLQFDPTATQPPTFTIRGLIREHDWTSGNDFVNLNQGSPNVELSRILGAGVANQAIKTFGAPTGVAKCFGDARFELTTSITLPSLWAAFLFLHPAQSRPVTYEMIVHYVPAAPAGSGNPGEEAAGLNVPTPDLPACVSICPWDPNAADVYPVMESLDDKTEWLYGEPWSTLSSDPADDLPDLEHQLKTLAEPVGCPQMPCVSIYPEDVPQPGIPPPEPCSVVGCQVCIDCLPDLHVLPGDDGGPGGIGPVPGPCDVIPCQVCLDCLPDIHVLPGDSGPEPNPCPTGNCLLCASDCVPWVEIPPEALAVQPSP